MPSIKYSNEKVRVTCRHCKRRYFVLKSTAVRSTFKRICYSCARMGKTLDNALPKSASDMVDVECPFCHQVRPLKRWSIKDETRKRPCRDCYKKGLRGEPELLGEDTYTHYGKPRSWKPTITMKPCLGYCGGMHPSTEPGDRICESCKRIQSQEMGGIEENTTGRYVATPWFPVG